MCSLKRPLRIPLRNVAQTLELKSSIITFEHPRLPPEALDHGNLRRRQHESHCLYRLAEARAGAPEAAQRRLAVLERLPLLDVTDAAITLAATLITRQALPVQAAQDTLHLAITCVHGVEYLLTWNCTYLANARLQSCIEQVCRDAGYIPPIICTPEELEG